MSGSSHVRWLKGEKNQHFENPSVLVIEEINIILHSVIVGPTNGEIQQIQDATRTDELLN